MIHVTIAFSTFRCFHFHRFTAPYSIAGRRFVDIRRNRGLVLSLRISPIPNVSYRLNLFRSLFRGDGPWPRFTAPVSRFRFEPGIRWVMDGETRLRRGF